MLCDCFQNCSQVFVFVYFVCEVKCVYCRSIFISPLWLNCENLSLKWRKLPNIHITVTKNLLLCSTNRKKSGPTCRSMLQSPVASCRWRPLLCRCPWGIRYLSPPHSLPQSRACHPLPACRCRRAWACHRGWQVPWMWASSLLWLQVCLSMQDYLLCQWWVSNFHSSLSKVDHSSLKLTQSKFFTLQFHLVKLNRAVVCVLFLSYIFFFLLRSKGGKECIKLMKMAALVGRISILIQ